MIPYKYFEQALKLAQDQDKEVSKLYDLGYDFMEAPLVEYADKMFDTLIESYFNKDGVELITWWLWEDVPKKIYVQVGTENTEIDVESIEQLYNYINDNCDLYVN